MSTPVASGRGKSFEDLALCHVCFTGNSTDTDRIVFCEGCNVAVHQSCYDVATVPQGDWYCDRCTAKVDTECVLCGYRQGAMKRIVHSKTKWAHLVCGVWLPRCGRRHAELSEFPIYPTGASTVSVSAASSATLAIISTVAPTAAKRASIQFARLNRNKSLKCTSSRFQN